MAHRFILDQNVFEKLDAGVDDMITCVLYPGCELFQCYGADEGEKLLRLPIITGCLSIAYFFRLSRQFILRTSTNNLTVVVVGIMISNFTTEYLLIKVLYLPEGFYYGKYDRTSNIFGGYCFKAFLNHKFYILSQLIDETVN